jgi:aminoglycoside phosphotransferase (APT) family kinase protein
MAGGETGADVAVRTSHNCSVRKSDITVDVVRRLITEQFPQWAGLSVTPVEHDGWDNTSFRLGDTFVVRLPSADGYVAQIAKEHRWLPVLAACLPLPIPSPVALGAPSAGFPRPWSVYRWLPGLYAAASRIVDVEGFAADLGDFLTALQRVDAADGPAAGDHSCWRGADLSVYDDDTRQAADDLAEHVDRGAVLAAWDRATATSWDHAPVWVHGDVAASNLLVSDGRLSGVIDFGCSAVGDPACDLVIAWTMFDGESRRAFGQHISLDDDTWTRASGWALWKALLTYRDGLRSETIGDAERRYGWRADSPTLIAELTAVRS